jgi:diguanylate cyclase (GGDEF)-like protein
MAPYVHDSELSTLGRVVSLAYPAGDIFVLGVLLRMTTGRGDRPPAYWLLVSSMIATLIGNVAYAVLELTIGYEAGSIIDVTWLAMYALGGAASVHPSMAAISAAGPRRVRGQRGPTPPRRAGDGEPHGPHGAGDPVAQRHRHRRAGDRGRLRGAVPARHRPAARARRAAVADAAFRRGTGDPRPVDGLANRRLFHARWQDSLGEAGGPTTLLYVDLDGFKPVNDTLGHDAGDTVLVEVAERLRSLVRAGDVVARLGGDEFAGHPAVDRCGHREAIAQRLVTSLAEPFNVAHRPVSIGASVGVVTAGPNANPEAELRRADSAMYAAKAAGRGRVEFAPAA